MTAEFILLVWFTNCGFNCNTEDLPKYERFQTYADCELALNEWLNFGTQKKIFFPGARYPVSRNGSCMKITYD